MSEAENWRPTASLDALRQRAVLNNRIRNFFEERGYWEVETPIMARYGVTDPYLANIKAIFRSNTYSLQTSPEYHMKRLLAAGSGPIFQMSRVFRDDELGRIHNPEFSLLEWYKLGVNHLELMQEVDDFLQQMIGSKPLKAMTYQEVFLAICSIDPLTADCQSLREVVNRFDLGYVLAEDEQDRDQYLFLLMSHVVEAELAKEDCPVAIYNFPISQASLARVEEGVAHRFEVYYRGMELANGFHELQEAAAQRQRFLLDQEQRRLRGLAKAESDIYLLQALEQGLPACSGVALGLDRLIALALNKQSIQEVMAFAFCNA